MASPLSFLQEEEAKQNRSAQTPGSYPVSFSWQHLKTTDKIKDQGPCGSCWAITTVTVVEAHYEIYMNSTAPKIFSAQELVSCVENPKRCGGDGGCKGATVELGMDYILANGLSTEDEAPYQGADDTCEHAKNYQTTTYIMRVMLDQGKIAPTMT